MTNAAPLELWAGVECTVNRTRAGWHDQLRKSGFEHRLDDLDRLASLGATRLRFPLLWERTAPHATDAPEAFDWAWADTRMARLGELGLSPIVGLLHHGSGPACTDLLDPQFPAKLEAYARAVARRFPQTLDWTPVNEPLTTARFSALYGVWWPHARDDASFVRALLNQVHGTVRAMRAIRREQPAARLVQTEDLGLTTAATPLLQYQADLENHRRWLSFDLLTGRVTPEHPLWSWLRRRGASEAELCELAEQPCPPDVVGINSYVTSERFLDPRLELYPAALHGGNGRHGYVDVETARVQGAHIGGFSARLIEASERYGLPVAITETHLGCTREEQLRWLHQAWRSAQALREAGRDVRAVTVWAAFGTFDWDSLVTCDAGRYEPGVWDVSATPQEPPRPTALATLARQLSSGQEPTHPVIDGPGWWQRELRLVHPCHGELQSLDVCGQPILITGATGTLGQAFARLCEVRGLPHLLLPRQALDIADAQSVQAALARWRPWAIVNTAGYVRVDEAERDEASCQRENTLGAATLAHACAAHGVQLVGFSSDLVFDGQAGRPYVESDAPCPLNAYGRSKVEAERLMLELAPGHALMVRTAGFFGPWDRHNFVTLALQALARGERWHAAADQIISPTYVPDLVNATLDLLIDGERGIWHLANEGALSWADLARQAARMAGLDASRVVDLSPAPARPTLVARSASVAAARRPVHVPLASERGRLMPPLQDALARYLLALDPALLRLDGLVEVRTEVLQAA